MEIQERKTWGIYICGSLEQRNKLNLHYKELEGTLSSSVERAPNILSKFLKSEVQI